MDILIINNVGISGIHSVNSSAHCINENRMVYDTNLPGVIRVTQTFPPLLRAVNEERTIIDSRKPGSLESVYEPGHPDFKGNEMRYYSSKMALNGMAIAFA